MELPASEVPARPRQLLDEIKITLPEHTPGSHRSATTPVEGHRLLTTEWPRLGAAASPDTPQRALVADLPEAEDPVDFNLEIEDGETTLFEAAINAFHAGEFHRAESLFLEEAQRNLETAPQRAAISYRQAALAAGQLGDRDASDHWMRLAGREYLRVTEDDRTPLPFIREAAVMAAKCFLSVENLTVASKGLRRAQAIESVIRADDDLMAHADDADQPQPVRPGPIAPLERGSARGRAVGAENAARRPVAGRPRMIERTPVDRTGADRASPDRARGERTSRERRAPRVVAASGAPVLPRPDRTTVTRRDTADVADAGWLTRLRQRRPARHPA
jgi:hypothetical protein